MQIVYIGNCLSQFGYTPTTVETLSGRLREFCVVHTYSNRRNPLIRLLHMLWGIWNHRKSVDLVLIDTYSSSAFYYAYICSVLCNLLNIPFVPYLHGGNLPNRLSSWPRLTKRYFGKAALLVAPSRYLYNHFIKAGYDRTRIIPNYIDIQNYPYKNRSKPSPKILWVRSFHKTYNPNLAVDILVLVKKEFPDATLCMVGPDKDGSMKIFKEYAASQGVLDAIQITGRLSKEDWIKLSSSYDFFLNTTNFDNTPVSVMEAMALGLLLVSTNAGGVSAIVNHSTNGYLYDCGDAVGGSLAIINCIQSNRASEISTNARQQAEMWDWDVVKKQWEKLFVSINHQERAADL